jgi:2-phosphosulfolactate phosphatase
VFRASLRNATATAKAAYEEQVARGGRTAINLVLAGGGGLGAGAVSSAGAFAVEDYLAAGAIGNALSALGIDHSAPDVAVATEGFRPLTRALKHLLSASASGLALIEAGRRDEVKAAAELDAEPEAARLAH